MFWENLRDLADLAERLPEVDFDRLIDRAHGQRTELEPFRTRRTRRAQRRASTRRQISSRSG